MAWRHALAAQRDRGAPAQRGRAQQRDPQRQVQRVRRQHQHRAGQQQQGVGLVARQCRRRQRRAAEPSCGGSWMPYRASARRQAAWCAAPTAGVNAYVRPGGRRRAGRAVRLPAPSASCATGAVRGRGCVAGASKSSTSSSPRPPSKCLVTSCPPSAGIEPRDLAPRQVAQRVARLVVADAGEIIVAGRAVRRRRWPRLQRQRRRAVFGQRIDQHARVGLPVAPGDEQAERESASTVSRAPARQPAARGWSAATACTVRLRAGGDVGNVARLAASRQNRPSTA